MYIIFNKITDTYIKSSVVTVQLFYLETHRIDIFQK